MKLRQLETLLEQVERFSNPKILLEQYVTSPHIAACIAHTAATHYEDIENKHVADFGCGCGVLGIAATIMDAGFITAIDIDDDALSTCEKNYKDFDINTVSYTKGDINSFEEMFVPRCFDTVLMNPPFGTKHNKGIDTTFLYMASRLCTGAIYSLHKTTTREHIAKKATDFGLKSEVVAELRYDIPASYKFHQKRTKDIQVDFWRFVPMLHKM